MPAKPTWQPVSRPDPYRCRECGIDEHREYFDLREKELCGDCGFWIEKVERAEYVQSIRVEGTCYWRGNEDERGLDNSMRGFGGRAFYYVKTDDPGQTVQVAKSLWHNGVIPERFKSRLPDNARWASEQEYRTEKVAETILRVRSA